MRFNGIYSGYIEQYLTFKRNLGFKLRDIEYVFGQFDQLTIARNERAVGITKELSDAWCEKRPNESSGTRSSRVSVISVFAKYLCNAGIDSYVPEVPLRSKYFTPYIFTKDQIRRIIDAVDTYVPTKITGKGAHQMMPALFRLLYGTGLRIGEALALKDRDVDIETKHITVKGSKNGMERLVPISDSLVTACRYHRCIRNDRQQRSMLFFTKQDGSPCGKCTVYQFFREALLKVGIPHHGKGVGPRVHDLRHTFACHALAAMAESGEDLYHALPILSTYLGHCTLESTDKYVRLTAEMYPDILQRMNGLATSIFPQLEKEAGS